MILFSGNYQNYSSVQQNSSDTYHTMINAAIESGVHYRIRITVSESGKIFNIFFQWSNKELHQFCNFDIRFAILLYITASFKSLETLEKTKNIGLRFKYLRMRQEGPNSSSPKLSVRRYWSSALLCNYLISWCRFLSVFFDYSFLFPLPRLLKGRNLQTSHFRFHLPKMVRGHSQKFMNKTCSFRLIYEPYS